MVLGYVDDVVKQGGRDRFARVDGALTQPQGPQRDPQRVGHVVPRIVGETASRVPMKGAQGGCFSDQPVEGCERVHVV